MSVYRFSDSLTAAWVDMTTTTRLDDGVPGDLTTSEQSVGNTTANTRPTLTLQSATATFVAQIYLETGHTLTSSAIRCATVRSLTVVSPACSYGVDEDPIVTPDDGAGWTLSVWASDSYVPVDEGNLSLTQGIETPQLFAISSTFTATTSCWLRLTISYTVYHVFCQGSLGANVSVSDFRFTGTDTGITCSEGPPPTDGPGTAPYPDPNPNAETECPCPDFTPAVAATVPFTNASRRTVTYNSNPCGQPLTYLQWSTGEYLVESNGTYYVRG